MERICSQKVCYLNEKQDASYLVDEIQTTLHSCNQTNLAARIQEKIDKYCIEMSSIHDILNTMKLYQKASLHPLSHTNVHGTHAPSQKELRQTIILLEKLQTAIKKLKDKRIEWFTWLVNKSESNKGMILPYNSSLKNGTKLTWVRWKITKTKTIGYKYLQYYICLKQS